jgi:hypothetical protein
MYNISADVLFGAVSTKRLTTLGPLVESYLAEMQDPRTRVRAAWTLAELGQTDVAQHMVEQHRQSGGRAGEDALDLLGGIHLVRLQDALPFIDDVLQANLTAQDGNSLLLVDHCIEALERIGTAGAVDRLAQLVLATVDDVGGIVPERALRAIETLAPRDRETWVIELVEKYPVRGILHRALDTLGVLGTEASLPILHKYLDGDQPEHIRTFAYRAIESIHRRSGRLWFNNEERSD